MGRRWEYLKSTQMLATRLGETIREKCWVVKWLVLMRVLMSSIVGFFANWLCDEY
jgi:hypothetical protein